MFKDYQTQVREDYNKKLFEGKLSANLTDPDPIKIKQECLEVYKERFLSLDVDVVHAFFGQPDDDGCFTSAIERMDEKKFLPLVVHLRHVVNEPKVITIELLAWLIDYGQRPYINPYKRPKDQTYQDYQTLYYNQQLFADEVPGNMPWWKKTKWNLFSWSI
jgi:hypothetical protein